MPVPLHTLKVVVRSNESGHDLPQHVSMALSGSLGIEEVVSVEHVTEPEEEPKKEDSDDGEGRDGSA